MNRYYLKGNVQIEPLVQQWHAYPFVISPATAAMVTNNYHLPTMQSYLQMPMAHVAALKNPDMIGGAFIDLGGKRLEDVKKLKELTESHAGDLVAFAQGIKSLTELLRLKAKGNPLEAFYSEIPDALKGFVELVYDLEHRPSFRLIERLLYMSSLYKRDAQTIALSLIEGDDRPFIFSTPRLKTETNMMLPYSFDDPRIDLLCSLKKHPLPMDEIVSELNLSDEDASEFEKFLTTESPRCLEKFDDVGVRLRYFGHACALFETADVAILTDPLISYSYNTDIPRFTFEDLPEVIDAVVITHCHHDHIVLESLLQLRSRIKKIIVPKSHNGSLHDPSMKLILENIGFGNVVEISDMETIMVKDVSITGIPFFGEHCDLSISSKSVYLLEMEQFKIMVSADSSSLNPAAYRQVHKHTGDIDMLLVGLECTGAPMSWAYGPVFSNPVDRKIDQVRRSKGSDANAAISMIDIFNPSIVYLYAMGLEPWLNYFMALQHSHSENTETEIEKLLHACAEKGITAEKLFASKDMVYEKSAIPAK